VKTLKKLTSSTDGDFDELNLIRSPQWVMAFADG
jgi:hypothetical protein